MSLLGIFIEWPWLALVPAVGFLFLYGQTGRWGALIAALFWLAYAAYEYGMQQRWLCSGECNIRVDLLLIYPFLLCLSIATAVFARSSFAQRRRR